MAGYKTTGLINWRAQQLFNVCVRWNHRDRVKPAGIPYCANSAYTKEALDEMIDAARALLKEVEDTKMNLFDMDVEEIKAWMKAQSVTTKWIFALIMVVIGPPGWLILLGLSIWLNK